MGGTSWNSVPASVDDSANVFGSLKVLLSAIYLDCKVRAESIIQPQTPVQGAAPVETKIKVLVGCTTVLEEQFDSKPSDVAEQRRRDVVIRYAIVILLL